jgi:hypothetical protein
MPQFDFLINWPLIFSLIIVLFIFCSIITKLFIEIIKLQKIRAKIVELKKTDPTEKFLKLKDICFFPKKK